MTYRVRTAFEAHEREYKVGTVHFFDEWPEEVRASEIAALVAREALEPSETATPAEPVVEPPAVTE